MITSIKLLLRTDGSIDLGNGHIIRMIALAEQLISRRFYIEFAICNDIFWFKYLKKKSFITSFISSVDQVKDLCKIIKTNNITHLVYDTRFQLTPFDLVNIRNITGVKICVIDTPEDTRLSADVVIYPPIEKVFDLKWGGFKGSKFFGWEYVLLRKDFLNVSKNVLNPKEKTVLLSFGSTDPYLISEKVLHLLAENRECFSRIKFLLLVGPQFNRLENLLKMEAFKLLNIKIIQNPKKIVSLFRNIDVALISFGLTAYELAACKVPFLSISTSDDHENSIKVFEENGLGTSLGNLNTFNLNLIEMLLQSIKNEHSSKKADSFFLTNTICDYSKIIKAITYYA